MIDEKIIEEVQVLFDDENTFELSQLVNKLLPNQLVELMNEVPEADLMIYDYLDLGLAVRTFKFLDLSIQKRLLKQMTADKVAAVLNHIPPDDRTWILKELPGETVQGLLKTLSPEERVVTLQLLGFPKYSVGRLMTPEYITIEPEWSAAQALDFVRKEGHNSETVNFLFIVDHKGILVDDVSLRDLLFAQENVPVKSLMDDHFVALMGDENQDTAINIFRKHNRTALPVTDEDGVLLGIITIDDILRLSNKEDTDDFQKVGGSEALNAPYMEIGFFQLVKKRISWLVVLFLGEMFTATAMSFYQHDIEKAVVLAIFLPLIISSGGNSGSQASTIIIRAMALGEVKIRDWWRIMRREIAAGSVLGLSLGAVGFLRVSVWASLFHNMYGSHWVLVALTIFFSLIGVVLWGTLSGSMLPIVLKKLGADPAASSAPFVATLVDVTGLIIYFAVAHVIFRGTLL